MAASKSSPACPLCGGDGGILVQRSDKLRVIRVDDSNFPAFYRVVWNAHVVELSDLSREDRVNLLDTVVAVETVLRSHLGPTKINLASFGNMVPHLHVHVIARFAWDSHFPEPVWGLRQRDVASGAVSRLAVEPPVLDRWLRAALAGKP